MPYLNMAVASDPESSWQVRLKGKTLKALLGDGVAYFGDFVELSAGGEDFASTLGVGGVVGTNFAWPGAPGKKDQKLLLTPEREKKWAFWVKLYQEKRLSQGEYLGALTTSASTVRRRTPSARETLSTTPSSRIASGARSSCGDLRAGATASATTRPAATSAWSTGRARLST